MMRRKSAARGMFYIQKTSGGRQAREYYASPAYAQLKASAKPFYLFLRHFPLYNTGHKNHPSYYHPDK
jgi:hypothetical protein